MSALVDVGYRRVVVGFGGFRIRLRARSLVVGIALAAAVIEREHPDAVLGSFAADHLIENQEAFTAAVAIARKAAELGFLVTLGISPTGPETGFGYIQEADPGAEGTAARALQDVATFDSAGVTEKR